MKSKPILQVSQRWNYHHEKSSCGWEYLDSNKSPNSLEKLICELSLILQKRGKWVPILHLLFLRIFFLMLSQTQMGAKFV